MTKTYSARSTMATPGLFKSYRHDPSKRMYTAATPRLSNPIAVADKERTILWSEGQSAFCTDLIISIGSGLEAEPKSYPGGSTKSGTTSIVGSLRKIGFQRESAKNMSTARSSQAASDEFASSLPASPNPPIYIRVNPISMIGLPAVDDIDKIHTLRHMTRAHIDKYEVKTLASKLLAALFYFETDRDIVEQADGQLVAQGLSILRNYNNSD
jgi:hypothetical protein